MSTFAITVTVNTPDDREFDAEVFRGDPAYFYVVDAVEALARYETAPREWSSMVITVARQP